MLAVYPGEQCLSGHSAELTNCWNGRA